MRPVLALFALLIPTLAGGRATEREALVDRCATPGTWNCNVGMEFPGAQGAVEIEKGPEPSVRVWSSFARGGNYVGAERALNVGAASSISFEVRNDGRNGGMIRIQDATGQEHAGGYSAPQGRWHKVTLPLDGATFPGHWKGANDGRFHFPLTGVLIALSHGESEASVLRIRNLTFTTSDASLYYGIRMSTSYPGNVAFTGPRPVLLSVQVENHIATPRDVRLDITATPIKGRAIAASLPITLGAYGAARRQISIPAALPAYYRVQAGVRDAGGSALARQWTGVVVTPRPANFGVDDPTSFFGIQQCSEGARTERLGVKWVRSGQDWRWGEMGERHVTWPDLKPIRANHQLIMYNITAYAPAWAEEKAGKSDFWVGEGASERVGWWSRFVEEVVRGTSKLVDTYEIQNEPDLTCLWQQGLSFEEGIRRYSTILGSGAAAIRRAAPGARVAGIDVSGGDYDQDLPFSRRMMALNGKEIDIYTGHPYAGVRYFGPGLQSLWPARNEEARKCRDTLAMIKQFGGKQRFWIGEKGWGLNIATDALSSYSMDFAACMVQSMALAHSVPGVERYYWFMEQGCNESGNEYGLFRDDKPLPAALAYATLARLLHHAAPAGDATVAPALHAHSFTRQDGAGVLVLWTDEDPVTLSVAAPAAWSMVDAFGGSLGAGKAGTATRIALSRMPVYLCTNARGLAAFRRALASARLCTSRPVRLEAAYLETTATAAFRLRNTTNEMQSGTVVTRLAPPARFRIEPGRVGIVRLPLPRPIPSTVRATVTTAGGQVEAAIPALTTPCRAATGRLDADRLLPASGAPDFVLDRRDQVLPSDPGVGWSSPADLSARIWTAWDATSLYLTVAVHDPVHYAPVDDPGGYWNGDSLQIGIDTANDAGGEAGYDANDVELGMALGPRGMGIYRSYPTSGPLAARCDGRRDGETTLYRAAIPWSTISARAGAGKVLGFNLMVNQNNGNGRGYWIGITAGIGEGKRPSAFRKLALTP